MKYVVNSQSIPDLTFNINDMTYTADWNINHYAVMDISGFLTLGYRYIKAIKTVRGSTACDLRIGASGNIDSYSGKITSTQLTFGTYNAQSGCIFTVTLSKNPL